MIGENSHAPMIATTITASMLYDLVHCPHRVWMDSFANPKKRDKASPFVQLLWERAYSGRCGPVIPLDVGR